MWILEEVYVLADIKLRETKKGTIKTLNKSVVGLQKMKSELVQAKEKIQDIGKQEDNANDYATGQVSSSMHEVPNTIYLYESLDNRANSRRMDSFSSCNCYMFNWNDFKFCFWYFLFK